MIAWIKRYQELGFVVHPCCPHNHYCGSPGKIPYDPETRQHMEGWQAHAQFPLDKWEEWYDLEPEINVGFLCGSPSKLLCVDIDNTEGEELFCATVSGEDRRTWNYRTGKGSRFLYRVHGGGVRSARVSKGGHDYELLGDGRQSVLPPSIHPSGRRYEWVSEATPRACRLLDAPSQLLIEGGDEITSEEVDWEGVITATTSEGARNETLTRLAGHLLAPTAVSPEEVYLWLKLYSQAHCKPPLPEAEIKRIIKSIAAREHRAEVEFERKVREVMKEKKMTYVNAKVYCRELM